MKKCGIYQIRNLVNGKVYIGSSVNIDKRWKQHLTHIAGGYHVNPLLQSVFRKYGTSNFVFDILEEVDVEKLLQREQYYLDKIKPWDKLIGYNLSRNTSNPMQGRKHTPETILKMQKPKTEEHKKKISESHKGKTISTEHKEKIRNHRLGKKDGPLDESIRLKIQVGVKKFHQNNPNHNRGSNNPRFDQGISIDQYTLNNEYIQTFTCIKRAIEFCGNLPSMYISLKRAINEDKPYKNYKWKYKNN